MPLTPTQAREEFKSYRAFRAWFREATGGNLDIGAALIAEMVRPPNDGEIGWLLLSATGDTAYTADTFRRAAGLALDTPEEK